MWTHTWLSQLTVELLYLYYIQSNCYIHDAHDTRAPSKRCRLGCLCDESMLYLAQCPKTARLCWSLLLSALQAFDEKTPSQGDIVPMERAIIFGVQNNTLSLSCQ